MRLTVLGAAAVLTGLVALSPTHFEEALDRSLTEGLPVMAERIGPWTGERARGQTAPFRWTSSDGREGIAWLPRPRRNSLWFNNGPFPVGEAREGYLVGGAEPILFEPERRLAFARTGQRIAVPLFGVLVTLFAWTLVARLRGR